MKKLDKNKYLRRLRLRKLYHQYEKHIYISIPCIVCIILGLYFTYSKFTTTSEDEVIRTNVGDFISGDVVIGAYINGEYSKDIPGKNDGYIVTKIVCDNNATGEWNYDDWSLVTKNLTTRSKCNIYFEKNRVNEIISKLDTTGKCPTINEDKTVKITSAETENSLVCSAQDDYGTSYYYRGNVTDNYVKFAGYYWRIVRINGDGSIRLIYDGTSAHNNDDTSEDRHIGISAFNELSDDNAYIGYMYGTANASSYLETHLNLYDSTIKKYIDSWYESNLKDTIYEQYLTDSGFCGSREIGENDKNTSNLGYGKNYTSYRGAYGPWSADENTNNAKISLKCQNKNDLYTINNYSGNRSLKYPISLLTKDEAILAGSYTDQNNTFFLYTGYIYWLNSPDSFLDYGSSKYVAVIRNLNSNGATAGSGKNDGGGYDSAANKHYVKPVINLKASILQQGSGTSTDPYRLED